MAAVTLRWLARGMDHVPAVDGWLAPGEAARLERMRFAKRRTEWRLGRWTAKQALARALERETDHHSALAALDIRIAPDGAPAPHVEGAPAPVSISMTDRADWAVCVVGAPTVGVGCDLELVEPRSELFVRDWFTPPEQQLLRTADPGEDWDVLANLVWCAKESALKVLRTGLRRDTRSVEVTLIDRTGDQDWARLTVRAEEGDVFPGWWRRFGPFLLTMAATVDTPPPAGFEEPSPLADARPAHSWLQQLP